jgi:hypothetical protein
MAESEYQAFDVQTSSGQPLCPLAVSNKLDEMSKLKRNWDGEDAPPIDPAVIAAARVLAARIAAICDVVPWAVPTPDGCVSLEFYRPGHGVTGPELDLEFDGPETIEWLRWWHERDIAKEGTCRADDWEAIRGHVQWFMEAGK